MLICSVISSVHTFPVRKHFIGPDGGRTVSICSTCAGCCRLCRYRSVTLFTSENWVVHCFVLLHRTPSAWILSITRWSTADAQTQPRTPFCIGTHVVYADDCQYAGRCLVDTFRQQDVDLYARWCAGHDVQLQSFNPTISTDSSFMYTSESVRPHMAPLPNTLVPSAAPHAEQPPHQAAVHTNPFSAYATYQTPSNHNQSQPHHPAVTATTPARAMDTPRTACTPPPPLLSGDAPHQSGRLQ